MQLFVILFGWGRQYFGNCFFWFCAALLSVLTPATNSQGTDMFARLLPLCFCIYCHTYAFYPWYIYCMTKAISNRSTCCISVVEFELLGLTRVSGKRSSTSCYWPGLKIIPGDEFPLLRYLSLYIRDFPFYIPVWAVSRSCIEESRLSLLANMYSIYPHYR
jgi:hypothetical protein